MTAVATTAISSFLMESRRKNIQPIFYVIVFTTDQLWRLVVRGFWRIHGEWVFYLGFKNLKSYAIANLGNLILNNSKLPNNIPT